MFWMDFKRFPFTVVCVEQKREKPHRRLCWTFFLLSQHLPLLEVGQNVEICSAFLKKTALNPTNCAVSVTSSSFTSQYFPVQFNKGEHGYDNKEMDMKPFFRAVGPVFHKNLEVGPFETVNIYPLMCHILGIQPEKNDGNLDNTKHMLAPGVPTSGEFLISSFISDQHPDPNSLIKEN